MKISGKCRQLQRGGTFVEMLVAGLLLSIGMMGLVNVWLFSFRVTENTDNSVIAYSLGRQAIEAVKLYGFSGASEGSSVLYYNGNQKQVAGTVSTARFKVTTSVVSDQMRSGTSGVAGGVPADGALRTVTVTVQLVGTGQTLYQTNTYLARAGI